MDEIGSLQQIFEKYEPPTQNCESLVGKPFGMNQCFPAFLVLIAGFFMVSIVFIVEFIWKYVSEKRGGKDTKGSSNGWIF